MATDIKTIFVDIDGCIVSHGSTSDDYKILPGVISEFRNWIHKGYTIIITTGRKESLREDTVKMLQLIGLPYDLLVMGLPRGPRVIINDKKPDSNIDTAECYNLDRNIGMLDLNI